MYFNETAVWGRDFIHKKNCCLAFRGKIHCDKNKVANLLLTGKDIYSVFLNGEFIAYGPERFAKGYASVDKLSINLIKGCNYLVVIVTNYYIPNYFMPKDDGFFSALVEIENQQVLKTEDFECFLVNDRETATQRYSSQRAFCEIYDMQKDRNSFYCGGNNFEKIKIIVVNTPQYIERKSPYPHYEKFSFNKIIENGIIKIDKSLPYKTGTFSTLRGENDGFSDEEIKEKASQTLSGFVYLANNDTCEKLKSDCYRLYEGEKNISGLINLEVEVFEDAELYIIFDEILSPKINESLNLDFSRLNCCNAVKWKLKAGKYNLLTAETYTFKYAKFIVTKGMLKVNEFAVIRYENPSVSRLKFKCADQSLNMIFESARNTVAQNIVDTLCDCPSRERAGWTNDAYFSLYSEKLFTGELIESGNLINGIASVDKFENLPEGMTPMCYPADFPSGMFIPNCGLWYVVTAVNYIENGGSADLEKIKRKIKGVLEYFKVFENEYGLLENLKGWIFIEWGKSNSKDYTCGVNFPSNMQYYQALNYAYKILGDNDLLKKAQNLKKQIIRFSYNGTFFEDNAVRYNGQLKLLGNITETCQYYAFETEIAQKNKFSQLYETLINDFEYGNTNNKFQGISRSNIIIGLLLRFKILMENNEAKQLEKEIKKIYLPMAEKTGTLWEHLTTYASCNHGITGFVAVGIIYCLTGYCGIKNGKAVFKEVDYSVDCEIKIPDKLGEINIVVKNGHIKIENVPYEIIKK